MWVDRKESRIVPLLHGKEQLVSMLSSHWAILRCLTPPMPSSSFLLLQTSEGSWRLDVPNHHDCFVLFYKPDFPLSFAYRYFQFLIFCFKLSYSLFTNFCKHFHCVFQIPLFFIPNIDFYLQSTK